MTNDTENLILRHLQAIRASQDEMRSELGEIKEELSRINLRLSVIEDNVGGILTLAASDRAKLDKLEKRVERIEKRLELID